MMYISKVNLDTKIRLILKHDVTSYKCIKNSVLFIVIGLKFLYYFIYDRKSETKKQIDCAGFFFRNAITKINKNKKS